MRPVPRITVLAAVAALAVVVAAPSDTPIAPASAHAASASTTKASDSVCSQSLDTKRQSVYRFRNGKRTLGFGRVTVTPTMSSRYLVHDRYCVSVQFGGREAFNAFSHFSYVRSGGRWTYEGAHGESGHRGPGYETTLLVAKGKRVVRRYEIKSVGRWYRTGPITRSNL